MSDIDLTRIGIAFAVLLVSLSVHEAAHAWSAHRLGDPTARRLGRVSLNPLVHIDPVGTVLFPLLAVATGFPVLGWAKPVPVNVLNLGRNWRQPYMLVAAAGPASNLVLAALAAALLHLVSPIDPGGGGVAGVVLRRAIEINVILAVFNMVPIPPLDGGNVLGGLLPPAAADAFDRVRPWGFVILYGLLFTGLLWEIVLPPARVLVGLLL